MTKAQRKLVRKARRARIFARIKLHRRLRLQRIARIRAARKLRINARRERIKKRRELKMQKRKAMLDKLTRKQRCRIFALKFKCVRRKFILMRKIKRHSLKRCRRVLKSLRFKFDKKKYIKFYRAKLNKNKLVHFKRFHCKGALHYLKKLRMKTRHYKRKFLLKRKKNVKIKTFKT